MFVNIITTFYFSVLMKTHRLKIHMFCCLVLSAKAFHLINKTLPFFFKIVFVYSFFFLSFLIIIMCAEANLKSHWRTVSSLSASLLPLQHYIKYHGLTLWFTCQSYLHFSVYNYSEFVRYLHLKANSHEFIQNSYA